MNDQVNGIVKFLMSNKDNRKVMAELKRSNGSVKLGAVKHLCQLTDGMNQWQEDVCYLTGALFANSPYNGTDNIGQMCTRLHEKKYNMEPVLNALLRTKDMKSIETYLRKIIGQAERQSIYLNWSQLIWDLFQWHKQGDPIQLKWAKAFYKN